MHRTDNDNFIQIGNLPSLESVYSIVIYEPKDGTIRHIHHTMIFNKSFNIDPDRLEKEAKEYALRLGHKIDGIRVLHIRDNKDFKGMYKVDVKKQALVKILAAQTYDKIYAKKKV